MQHERRCKAADCFIVGINGCHDTFITVITNYTVQVKKLMWSVYPTEKYKAGYLTIYDIHIIRIR